MEALLGNADAIAVLADLVTALGVFSLIGGGVAFFLTYVADQKAQRERAEYGTYDALDDRYIEFQRLSFEHPDLDIADIPRANPPPLNELQLQQRRIAYQILIATFERAFVMYRLRSQEVREIQWEGWSKYIDQYCGRPGFIDAYFLGNEPSEDFSPTWDASFEADMKARFRERGILSPKRVEPAEEPSDHE